MSSSSSGAAAVTAVAFAAVAIAFAAAATTGVGCSGAPDSAAYDAVAAVATTLLPAPPPLLLSPSAATTPRSNSCAVATSSSAVTDGGLAAAIGCSVEYAECSASRWLYVVLCPLMLAAGTVGNLLTLLTVASTPELRRTAFGVYIASLAVTDLAAMWSALLRHFVKNALLYDVREASVWSCRLHRYLVYASIDSSAWLLVALTAGRLLSVWFPERSRGRPLSCSCCGGGAARARLAVPLIVAAQLAWNAPTLWMLGEERSSVDGSLIRRCGYPDAASALYWTAVQPYLSMAAASVLPFVLMLAMNGAIVVALRRRATGATSVYRRSRRDQGVTGGSGESKAIMLLAVSFVFLVATVPTFVSTALEKMTDANAAEARARTKLADSATTLMLYANGSLNFFLYCLAGRTFRRHCARSLAALRARLTTLSCCCGGGADQWPRLRPNCAKQRDSLATGATLSVASVCAASAIAQAAADVAGDRSTAAPQTSAPGRTSTPNDLL